jgi:hypothetical protein
MIIGTAMAAATTVIETVETTAIGTTTATGRSTATRVTTTAMTTTGRVETTATYGNKGDHDGNDDNGHWKGGNNGNWKKYGNKGDHNRDENWSKNGYKHWSQNHKNHGNGWSGYNNNWNKNWDRRAYVRNWNRQPYYGEFIGGVVLGSILAANGVGIVPYAPEPYLCWYWADPYMIRGYWDYCY